VASMCQCVCPDPRRCWPRGRKTHTWSRFLMLPTRVKQWGWQGLRSSRIGAESGASACCGWYVQERANLRSFLHLDRRQFGHARGRTHGCQQRHKELGTNKKGP
jgi:hypothetical protein